MNYLLDTNTVIYLINDRLATALPAGRHGVAIVENAVLLSNDAQLANIPNLELKAVSLKDPPQSAPLAGP